MLGHFFSKEIFPNIQSRPPLMQQTEASALQRDQRTFLRPQWGRDRPRSEPVLGTAAFPPPPSQACSASSDRSGASAAASRPLPCCPAALGVIPCCPLPWSLTLRVAEATDWCERSSGVICACRAAQAGRKQSSEIPSPNHRGCSRRGAFLKTAKPSQHLLCHVVSCPFPVKGCRSLLLV